MQSVESVMTRPPLVTIRPHAVVSEAVRLVADRQVSHLLVVDGETLVGLVCACDLQGADLGESVGGCLRSAVHMLEAEASAFDAARCMLDQGISCLPVVRDGALVGVVTASDLRRAGVLTLTPDRCAACGSGDHVRCSPRAPNVGFCLECTLDSEPPGWDDELGGG